MKGYTDQMNRLDRDIDGPPALVDYLDGEICIIRPGAYVLCAITGAKIPLEGLRYWSVDLQEPYANPAVGLKRMQEKGLTP